MSGRSLLDQFRRGLDRASFEADRMMRYNRVKAEAARLRQQGRERTFALGEKALELYRVGTLPQMELGDIARELIALEDRIAQKEKEAGVIQAEEWIVPEGEAADGDPQIGASSGPAPQPVPPRPASSSVAATPAATEAKPGGHHYCPACGNEVRPGSHFCMHCGAKQQ
jgi:hypothetical protein